MSEWFYADANRERQGPHTAEQLTQLFHQGKLRLDSLVWRDGLAEWRPLRDFTQELALHQTPVETFYTPVEPAVATTISTPAATVLEDAGTAPPSSFPGIERSDSPYAPPLAELTSDESFHGGGEVVHAGFWKRVAAYFIDGTVVGIAGGIVGAIIGGIIGVMMSVGNTGGTSGFVLIQVVTNLVSISLAAAYYAGFHASTSQATLGKMAVGIKVVRTDGTRITIARGVGRYFATILSGLILGIGFLMAAFTERKQALHDMICDTLVVDKWAYTAHPEWQKRELGTVTIVILAIFGVLMIGLIALFAVIIGLAASSGSWH